MGQRIASFWSFLWISIVLCLVGWGGLMMLIAFTLPTLGPRWLFFFLLDLALSGTALPVTYFFNRRFLSDPPVGNGVILREAMWVGVYGSLLAWLQLGRVLNSGQAMVLAVGLVLVETLLRLGERSSWSPAQATDRPADLSGEVFIEEDDEEEGEDEGG